MIKDDVRGESVGKQIPKIELKKSEKVNKNQRFEVEQMDISFSDMLSFFNK